MNRFLIITLSALLTLALVSCVSSQGLQAASPALTTNTSEMTAAGESPAYITALTMRSDGQADITFDFVEWLSGDEAKVKYLEDHPGATEEETEGEGIYEMGYIRNISGALRTLRTTSGTKYFLPDALDMSENIEVGYDEFKSKMLQAIDMGIDEHLTFVNVSFMGEEILKIEWLYTP